MSKNEQKINGNRKKGEALTYNICIIQAYLLTKICQILHELCCEPLFTRFGELNPCPELLKDGIIILENIISKQSYNR